MTPKYDEFIDGVLGLSFGARINTTTVLESMIAQNLIDKGIVSFALGKQSESGGGEVLFGGIDSKVADGGNITYTDVISSALLTLPTSIASAIHKIIPRSIRLHEVWYIPCVGTLTLEFAIEGVKFAIPYSDLARENSALADFCHSAVQTNPGDFAIIGDVFFKNSYVIFDEDNRKMGFAPLVPQ
ncbi:hypothetical protein BGX28_007573 [Mortierella sp. GBA30]|nr:hypothetical protein BGX28_007573 [Mortierella sp. GBA30]